jgi:hypothetical protein
MDHAPHFFPQLGVAQQHAQQLGGIQAIALGPSLPAVDLDARRIDDQVG